MFLSLLLNFRPLLVDDYRNTLCNSKNWNYRLNCSISVTALHFKWVSQYSLLFFFTKLKSINHSWRFCCCCCCCRYFFSFHSTTFLISYWDLRQSSNTFQLELVCIVARSETFKWRSNFRSRRIRFGTSYWCFILHKIQMEIDTW